MDDAGNGGASAVVDIRHGAGDGSRSGNASEDGRHDVGDALSYQLCV